MRGGTSCALLGLALIAAGCASGRGAPQTLTAPDPVGAVPDDLSIDLNAWPLPGRYVIFCDGSLHWEATPGKGDLPPLRRVLSRAELAEVWSLVQGLGPDTRGTVAPLLVPRGIDPAPGESVFLGTFFADGRRWSVLERPGSGEAESPATTRLLEKLNALAWVDEAALRPKPPHRDDFGPDPYARYRR